MKNNKPFSGVSILVHALLLFSYPALSQGISISTGAIIKASGAARIELIDGNFINNGTYSKGSETVVMSGTSQKLMLGSGSTDMNDLEIKNTSGITTRIRQITLHNLTIYTASKLTIDTTSAVIASNVVRNKATVNDLIIKANQTKANGTLVFNNNVDSVVLATVEMYNKASKPSTSSKWQFFGIPVRNLYVDDSFTGSYVRKYNEAGWYSGYTPDKHWIQLVTGDAMTAFTGYEVTQVSPKTVVFQGALVNNDFISGKLPITVGAQYPGQHLIGNSYTGAIDIKKIVFGSSRAAVIQNSVYLYNTGSLDEWTNTGKLGSVGGEMPGQYVGIPAITAGENGLPSQIPSMQAFLVTAVSNNDSANIKIPYSSVGTIVRNTDQQRAPSNTQKSSTRIEVSGCRFADKMWLFTDESCSSAFDNGWDAYKLIGTSAAPQIFATETSGSYQVSSTSDINNTSIGFIGGEDLQYTMTFTHVNTGNKYAQLYLIDSESSAAIDISASGTQYSFGAAAYGLLTNRFKIVTNLGMTTELKKTVEIKQVLVYGLGKNILINNLNAASGKIRIYDMLGKEVLNANFDALGLTKVASNLIAGSYVAKTVTAEGEKTSKLLLD